MTDYAVTHYSKKDKRQDAIAIIIIVAILLLIGYRVRAVTEPDTKIVKEIHTTSVNMPIDILCDEFEVRGQVDCVDGYTGTNFGSFDAIDHIPCQEDEVVAVKVTDPSPGLTWECVNAEEYVNEYVSQLLNQ